MDNASGKRPIIALDHTSWDGNWMNRQHILSRLGERGWPIIYSNGAKFYNEVNLSKPFGSVEKKDNVALYHPGFILPRNYKLKTLDKLAIKQHCRDLKKKAGLKKGDDFITFCFHPDFYPYVEELDAPYVMFHIYDVYQKLDLNKNENNALGLIEKANLITAASEDMWDEVVQTSKIAPNIIYNGVNYSNFENIKTIDHNIIDKINSISGYKVGYVGAINLKIDFELVVVIMGESWLDVIPVMRVLSLIGVVLALRHSPSSLLTAIGKVKLIAIGVWLQLLFFLILCVVVFPKAGLVGIALIRLLMSSMQTIGFIGIIIQHKLSSTIKIIKIIWRPVLSSLVMMGSLSIYQKYFMEATLLNLLLQVILGAIFYSFTLLVSWYLAGKPEGIEEMLILKYKKSQRGVT